MLSRFDRIPACDKRTDGRTNRQTDRHRQTDIRAMPQAVNLRPSENKPILSDMRRSCIYKWRHLSQYGEILSLAFLLQIISLLAGLSRNSSSGCGWNEALNQASRLTVIHWTRRHMQQYIISWPISICRLSFARIWDRTACRKCRRRPHRGSTWRKASGRGVRILDNTTRSAGHPQSTASQSTRRHRNVKMIGYSQLY